MGNDQSQQATPTVNEIPENAQRPALTPEQQEENFLRAVGLDPALGMPPENPNSKPFRPQDAEEFEESSSK